MENTDFWSGVLKIIVIDLVLSGDNAIVIGMAAHRLEPKQRKFAILFGGAGAIVLRILLTLVAAYLLQVPVLQLAGGILLVWIAFKLLKADEESHEGVKVAASFREAMTTILIADFIMSLDNVLSVAAASHGNYGLLMFGLLLSMAILMFMGNLVANLINKIWWLSYVGAAVIAWTGVEMVFADRWYIEQFGHPASLLRYGLALGVTVATLAVAHWYHRVREA